MNRYIKYSIAAIIWVVVCNINYCGAQTFDRNEDQFAAKGNKFEFQSQGVRDEQTITDPITGKEITKFIYGPQPSAINGKKIYEWNEITTPPTFNPVRVSPPLSNATDISLEEYLLNNLKDDKNLTQAPDGILNIRLNGIVLDENGKVVYFLYSGIQYTGKDDEIRAWNQDNLAPKIEMLMANAPSIRPATLNGTNVPVRLQTSLADYKLHVSNHLITYSLEPHKAPYK